MRYTKTVLRLNEKNSKGYQYTESSICDALAEAQEKVDRRIMLGQVCSSPGEQAALTDVVSFSTVTHIVERLYVQDGELKAEIKPIKGNYIGDALEGLLEKVPENLAFSLRAEGIVVSDEHGHPTAQLTKIVAVDVIPVEMWTFNNTYRSLADAVQKFITT